MKRILVIGNQGYIGSRLTPFLAERGYSVKGIDLGRFENCKLSGFHKEISTIRKSAKDISLDDLLHFDAVINLAGNSNDPENHSDPDKYYREGEDFSINIAKYCKELGIKYIFPSSCSVYGASEGICDEESSLKPLTAYSKSKVSIEDKLAELSSTDFTPIVLRLATVFGYSPRMRFDIVINMFAGMLITSNEIILNSDGLSWRPHLYIDDACSAFACAVDWEINSGEMEVLNVGNNANNLTIRDAAEKMMEMFPKSNLRLITNGEAIFADKNVNNGKDLRDYRVNFDKIYDRLPAFYAKTNILSGTNSLINNLIEAGITKELFADDKFYRLRFLEKSSWASKKNENNER